MVRYRPVKNMEARQKVVSAIRASSPAGFTANSIKRSLAEVGEVVSLSSIRRVIASMMAEGEVCELVGSFANQILYVFVESAEDDSRFDSFELSTILAEFDRACNRIKKLILHLEKEATQGRMIAKKSRIKSTKDQMKLPLS